MSFLQNALQSHCSLVAWNYHLAVTFQCQLYSSPVKTIGNFCRILFMLYLVWLLQNWASINVVSATLQILCKEIALAPKDLWGVRGDQFTEMLCNWSLNKLSCLILFRTVQRICLLILRLKGHIACHARCQGSTTFGKQPYLVFWTPALW